MTVDDDTGTVSADSHYERIDIKEEVDPISTAFPSVKPESEVSLVFTDVTQHRSLGNCLYDIRIQFTETCDCHVSEYFN
jgi:hypothetical protein